jgi:hypothetical protein
MGPRAQSERGGEEKNSYHLPGLEPPFIQPVAQRYKTELSLLLASGVTASNILNLDTRCK